MNLILQETDRNTAFCTYINEYSSISNHCFSLVKKDLLERARTGLMKIDLLKLMKEKEKLFKNYIAKKIIKIQRKKTLFGFGKKHSTNNALTVMMENVSKACKEKNIHLVFSWICQKLLTRLIMTSLQIKSLWSKGIAL